MQEAKHINQFVPLITASSHERGENACEWRRRGTTLIASSARPGPRTPQYPVTGLVTLTAKNPQQPQALPVEGKSRHPGAAAVVAQAGVHPGLGEDDINLVLLGRVEKS